MRRLLPGILPFLVVTIVACGGDNGSAGPTNLEAPDTRSTGELASADGNFRVRFTLEGGVPPKVPILVAFDGREPDPIMLSRPIDERRYQLTPGSHRIAISLDQASCGVNRSIDEEGNYHSLENILVLENHVGNYQVDVDCTSILDTWVVKVTPQSEKLDEGGFTLTFSNPEFGTRTEHLPAEGRLELIGYHVGWYKLRLTDVDPNCSVRGLGAPGWGDSIEIKPYSGVIFYWVTCS